MDRKIAHARKAHWLVAHAKHDQNQPKSFPFLSLDKKQRNANIVYSAFGGSYKGFGLVSFNKLFNGLKGKCFESPNDTIHVTVTSKPKKKDSDMKIDMTTYTDKENQIGLTADHTSRPDKVLFFADPHFLFKSQPTLASRTSQRTNQNLPKRAILLTHRSNR